MTKSLRTFVALTLITILLSGCGGGSHNNAPAAARSGRATFKVHWPKRTTRLIPVASNSILVVILRNGTQVASRVLPRPLDTDETQTTFDPLPVGDLVVNASAFPNADGTGIAQATGSAGLRIQPNANTTINLTMGTTITHVVVAPQSTTLVFGNTQNNTVTLTASAMDANDNVVLTSGLTFNWTTTNNKIVSVLPNGSSATASATGIGTVAVIVSESESNISGQAQVKVQGQGLAKGTWGKFRSNAGNTGVGTAINLNGAFRWCTATGGPIESSPAIALDGTVYVGSADGNVYAFDGSSGAVKWSAQIGGHIKSSPVLGADGTIYAASTNGQVVALEKTDGSQKWNVSFFGSSYTSSPTIGPDGNLYIAGEDAVVRALDGSTGDQVWAVGFASAIESSPAISSDGMTIFLGAGDKQMHALRTTDGSQIWTFTTGGAIQSSPALDQSTNILYFGADDGKVYAVRATDGTSFWSEPAQTGGIVSSSPAILSTEGPTSVFVGSTDGKLYALSASTGAQLAAPFQTGGGIHSSPAISQDETIVFGSDDGKIYGIRVQQTGLTPIFSYSTGAGVVSSPGLGNNSNILVGSTDSKLYSLGGP